MVIAERSSSPVTSPRMSRWTADVDATLRSGVPAGDALAARMTSYHMGWIDADGSPARAGGKHFRSNLCCWATEACGGSARRALPAAAAIELVHNFTLVHDDVQDGDRTRRGRPTVWSIWGTAQAINAGDLIFAYACRVLLGAGEDPERRRQATRVLLDAVVEVIDGQCLDIENECSPSAGLATYVRMVTAKTGALIGASLETGAVMAGADQAVRARLRRAGRLLGVAFQLRDDWLGIWGDSAITGKSRQGDLERRKLTHPVAAAYDVASGWQRHRLEELFRTRGAKAEPEIRQLLEELGAAEATASAAAARAAEAVAEIRNCDFDQAQVEEFASVAQYVAERTS
jgi:geranylgeranyl diphosphate synthase, type I